MDSLYTIRKKYKPNLPKQLDNFTTLSFEKKTDQIHPAENLREFLPHLFDLHEVSLVAEKLSKPAKPLNIGVVFSGGPASGGHNVIAGIYDALKKLHKDNRLFGFLNGPSGIVSGNYSELSGEIIDEYRNCGGFDMIGTGRTKIESEEQLQHSEQSVRELHLHALIIIGGDDSNTNAAFLADYFIRHNTPVSVIGIPKTIDGDLKNAYIPISFGFDTAAKIYSNIIGNLACDAASAGKYYFFVKMMGRSASHITLECALQTGANHVLIGEEIAFHNKTLKIIVSEIADTICERAKSGKNYGVILIPEGTIEFIKEFSLLIGDLNAILAHENIQEISQENKIQKIANLLPEHSKECFILLPDEIKQQLLMERDPHGNVQVSKIESERLFIMLVTKELHDRKQKNEYSLSFSAQPYFCGYEGRSAYPSNFDAQYCYTLGHIAVLLAKSELTGYMACVTNPAKSVAEWGIGAVPLISMMSLEKRKNKIIPVIAKSLVDLQGPVFQTFLKEREHKKISDNCPNPGPIQFFGPEVLTESITATLMLESKE